MGEDLGEDSVRKVRINECTTLSPSPSPSERVASGFTLAEVLITLVIIGVIAAITVPSLISKYKHEQTVVKLKKAYSEVAQALRLAEVEHGTMNSWDFGEYSDGIERNRFFAQNYLFKNMKIMKTCIPTSTDCFATNINSGNTSANISAIAINGYSLLLWVDKRNIGGWIYVDIDGPNKGPNTQGKDIFPIKFIYKNKGLDAGNNETKLGVWLSGLQYKMPYSREELKGNNAYCGALIQYDGWQYKPDNPCY